MSDNNFLEGTTLTGKNDPDITYKFKNGEWYMVGSDDELISIDQDDFFKNEIYQEDNIIEFFSDILSGIFIIFRNIVFL